MTIRQCPKCRKTSLRIVNVMGTTQEIHWKCNECCYKEKTGYNYRIEVERQTHIEEMG